MNDTQVIVALTTNRALDYLYRMRYNSGGSNIDWMNVDYLFLVPPYTPFVSRNQLFNSQLHWVDPISAFPEWFVTTVKSRIIPSPFSQKQYYDPVIDGLNRVIHAGWSVYYFEDPSLENPGIAYLSTSPWDELIKPVGTVLQCPHGYRIRSMSYIHSYDHEYAIMGWANFIFNTAEQECNLKHGVNFPAQQGASVVQQLRQVFSGMDYKASCPDPIYDVCHYDKSLSVSALVPHLNDCHQWSREKIADWLDSLNVDFTLIPTSIGD